jgi:hypothetical protein
MRAVTLFFSYCSLFDSCQIGRSKDGTLRLFHADALDLLNTVRHTAVSIAVFTQIGMSKDRMLRLFHADALDLLNITNSLKQVCEELASPTFRMARKVGV